MRIITGQRKGLKLKTPPEASPIRPTTDMVKESVFNLINIESQDKFLDLFAGTGQVGLEALSRGCKKAVFCDNSPEAVALIKANIKKTGLENAEVFFGDYRKYLKNTTESFDIIYIDPPYDRGLTLRALEVIADRRLLSENGVVVTEQKRDEETLETVGELYLKDSRRYGISLISIYAYRKEESL